MLFKVVTRETFYKEYNVLAENEAEAENIISQSLCEGTLKNCDKEYLVPNCEEAIYLKYKGLDDWYFYETKSINVSKELIESFIEDFIERVPGWELTTIERFLWWLDSVHSDTPVDFDLFGLIELVRRKYNLTYLKELKDTLDKVDIYKK